MSDSSTYSRKLAEALEPFIDECFDTDQIAAVLAAEDVVDPEQRAREIRVADQAYRKVCEQLAAVRREFDEIVTDKDKQLAALRGENLGMRNEMVDLRTAVARAEKCVQEACADEANEHSCVTWSECCDCSGTIAKAIMGLDLAALRSTGDSDADETPPATA